MHNDYITPGGKWPNGTPPLPKRISALDIAISQLINGDDGGTYAPLVPITLVSQTSTLTLTLDGQISGGISTQRGGRIAVPSAPRFVNGSDSPTARTRTVLVPLMPRVSVSTVVPDHVYSAGKAAIVSYAAAGGVFKVPLPSHRMHHGVALTTATLYWRCGLTHGGVPVSQPTATIYRANVNGTSMTSVGSATSAASTAVGYYNNGLVQPLPITVTETIDITQFHYLLGWTEESGTNHIAPSFNQLAALALTYTPIAGAAFE